MSLKFHIISNSKIEMWYLHGSDRSFPYEVTCKAVDELYRKGYFKRFGISNYMSWVYFPIPLPIRTLRYLIGYRSEVAEMVGICEDTYSLRLIRVYIMLCISQVGHYSSGGHY